MCGCLVLIGTQQELGPNLVRTRPELPLLYTSCGSARANSIKKLHSQLRKSVNFLTLRALSWTSLRAPESDPERYFEAPLLNSNLNFKELSSKFKEIRNLGAHFKRQREKLNLNL